MKRIVFTIAGLLMFSSTDAQALDILIEEALGNSPEIQKFDLQYRIASEKVNEVNAIPNTEIGVGYFVSEPETRTGAQRIKISAKQMLPWFGAVTARENYESAMAKAKYEDIAIAKRKLIASVSQSYYNLYALKAKQELLTENIKLLNTYEKLALTSVEVGNASAVDVLRLQIRQNELEQLKQILEQQYAAAQTALNKRLNREQFISVKVIDTLLIPLESDPVTAENLQLHPELLKYDMLYESVNQSELLNQKESSPMIGFGVDYIAVSERPDMTFSDNGKDIVMPMVSLSIPIFNKKYKSKTIQNELEQQALKTQKQERLNTLETLLDKAVKDRISARISYTTQTENLKRAKDVQKMLLKRYETGIVNFNDVLDIQELQLKFQNHQIEAVLQYYMQTAIIHYLTQ